MDKKQQDVIPQIVATGAELQTDQWPFNLLLVNEWVNGFVLLVLLSFMWYVYVPVLTEDALPCFTDNTSVVFSIPIVAIWEKKSKQIFDFDF